ncbi:hypothetical protein Dsin_008533 [Dipteronia sinensis]|uniref:Uncharacterized protein n=1 Tax=Dipteronia sinensis TaxID=43782 RepID=A0AAE0APD0_9ROSI|nr:hypothetical protein Dsin_008533 [Dipteronia sinensis]
MQSIKILEKEVETFLERDEMYWKQRSRADWLAAEDRNTSFFHTRAKARHQKNLNSKLVDREGQVQDTKEGMAKVFCEYFANIFQTSYPSPHNINLASGAIGSSLNGECQSGLSKAFTTEEIKFAIFEIGPTKAPGLHSFQAIFIHKFLSVVG